MAKWTPDQLSMLPMMNSGVSPSATSSPELADGHMPCALPDGQTPAQYGPDHARASRSQSQAKEPVQTIQGICGPTSIVSSPPSGPLSSWESKLRERLAGNGSTLCQMIWKQTITSSGRSIFRLSPLGLNTSVRASIGLLPTPSGTSNHGINHVAGRLDEWGGSSNPFRGTSIGKVHCPSFELWMMGFPAEWAQQMPPAMPSSRRSQQK